MAVSPAIIYCYYVYTHTEETMDMLTAHIHCSTGGQNGRIEYIIIAKFYRVNT